MSIETQLTFILAAALLGVAFVFTLASKAVVRLVRGPAPASEAAANLDDALPGRRHVVRERAAGLASGAGAVAVYMVATIAAAAKRVWALLDRSRRRIPGSVTLGLVTPGPALTEVLRETSTSPAPKRAALATLRR